jgi:hypothetical protein
MQTPGQLLEQDLKSSGLPLTAIERPPKVSEPHMLGIMPGPKGFDLRNFECDKCDHVVTVTMATEPMNSDLTGWLDGGLGCA